jgi:putative transposase
MSELLMLSLAQMRKIEPYFPLSHGVPRIDDRRALSGILSAIRNGPRWRDAPEGYAPHKTMEPARRIQPHPGGTCRRWPGLGSIDDRYESSQGASYCGQSAKKGLYPDVLGAAEAAA